MKKNLISILILALMVVNVVLTAIMMFSVTGTAKKTNALVSNIASVLNIELSQSEDETEEGVSIADSEAVDIGDTLTIPLKKGEDGKDHFYLVDVTLYMNKKHEDYETYKETVTSSISLFKSIIIEVISSHTLEEAQSNPEMMRNEILSRIQTEYSSTFIYKVTFSNIMYQ
ncbi:MAG: flagellar basal body-associated FliL family protein [Lachnospiraceae bacterium]|jgi:flagellar FliL protein|nr:flagellar basal body-associated FliL family protein [Lachnospiraceae bacterium]